MPLIFGETAARAVSSRIHVQALTAAALAANYPSTGGGGVGEGPLDYGVLAICGDGTEWRYSAASTATADGLNLLCMSPSDAPTAGRWLRQDKFIDCKLAIAFGTADATALLTLPAGFKAKVSRPFWEVTTSFTGGSSSAIGISSTDAAASTKGDLLGGASGDVAATLVSTAPNGYAGGTIGTKLGTQGVVCLVGGDAVRFDRITSAFTAGAGFVHFTLEQIL